MNTIKKNIALSGLFHDIGKVIRRGYCSGEHSYVGAEFLKKLEFDRDIVTACRYHHGKKLKGAKIEDNHIAYIIYIADNISSSADRRYIEGDDDNDNKNNKFNEHICLKSVFNKLNSNNGCFGYNNFNYKNVNSLIIPATCSVLDKGKYLELTEILRNNLKSKAQISINSYLELIEGIMAFVPSCTAENDMNDISLYDHSKITAGLALCIFDYLNEKGINNYKECLLKNGTSFFNEKAFLLASFDVSGIQKFIYSVKREGALKQLRARSTYLELMSKNLIDEILTACDLCEVNVIYDGGGHAYMVLPNTPNVKSAFYDTIAKQNKWLLERFREKLYVSGAVVECSANELCNKNKEGKVTDVAIYGNLLQKLVDEISINKLKKFNAEQINYLNNNSEESVEECSVCGLNIKNNQCICSKMSNLGKNIITKDVFLFTNERVENGTNLEFFSQGCEELFLNTFNKNELEDFYKEKEKSIVKYYAKNNYFVGDKYSGKFFVGDYCAKTEEGYLKSFEDFEKDSIGINRLAVLRADVDDLSNAFKNGFENKYATLSRFATLSRMLSRFFKFHINEILESNKYVGLKMLGAESKKKDVSIIYSGGDDVCVVGSWNDVLEFAGLLQKVFEAYSSNALTISAGVGLYKSGYPVARMVSEVGALEDFSKDQKNKDSITLFTKDGSATFLWKDFKDSIVEKLRLIENYFNNKFEKVGGGKSFIYNLIDLLRKAEQKRPQIAYLLARVVDDNQNKKDAEFVNKLFEWSRDKKETKELIMALTLYVYSIREEK